ncbi:MAG TPA: hypothetical protein VK142_12170 [Bacillota bacterium]|nr:hypothetical protein [Bacillota bacterium]
MLFYVIWLVISYIFGVLYATGFTSMKYIKFQDWIDEEKRAAERKAIILIFIGLVGVIAIGVYGFIEKGLLFLLLLVATQAYNVYGQIRHVAKKRNRQKREDAKAAEESDDNEG